MRTVFIWLISWCIVVVPTAVLTAVATDYYVGRQWWLGPVAFFAALGMVVYYYSHYPRSEWLFNNFWGRLLYAVILGICFYVFWPQMLAR